MIDFSIYFTKIRSNQYIYRTNRLFSSYGYQVTYKEKSAIEGELFYSLTRVMGVSPAFIPAFMLFPKKGYFLYFTTVFFFYLRFRKKFKKIIGGRSKLYCGRESNFVFFQRASAAISWRQIAKYIGSWVVFLSTAIFLFFDWLGTGNKLSFYFFCIMLLGFILLTWTLFMLIYSKIKKTKATS